MATVFLYPKIKIVIQYVDNVILTINYRNKCVYNALMNFIGSWTKKQENALIKIAKSENTLILKHSLVETVLHIVWNAIPRLIF